MPARFAATSRNPRHWPRRLNGYYSGATLRVIGGGSRSDLEDLNRAIAAHRLRPVIDRVFPFQEAPAAASYMANGAQFGKIVISH